MSKFEPAREVICFASAKISLKDAVEAAEKQGGRAIEAHYHQADELGCLVNRPGYYEVTLLDQGNLISVAVDIHSNDVASRPSRGAFWDRTGQYLGKIFASDPADRARIASTVALKMPDAIATAEKASGRAMKAYIDSKGGIPGYTVKLVESGKVRVAWVDGG